MRALADTELPGRLELCGREPFLLVDGAHTPRSLEAALQVLEELPHRHRYLVLSLSSGKDIDELCRVITPGCRQVFLTRAEPSRSLPLDELERAVAPFLTREQIRSVADPERALAAAKEAASPEDLVCAVGSIYLAGIARKVYAAG